MALNGDNQGENRRNNQGRDDQRAVTLVEVRAECGGRQDPRFLACINAHDEFDLHVWNGLSEFHREFLCDGVQNYLQERFEDELSMPPDTRNKHHLEDIEEQVVTFPLKDAVFLQNVSAVRSNPLSFRLGRGRWGEVDEVGLAFLQSLLDRGWEHQAVYFEQLRTFQRWLRTAIPYRLHDSFTFHCGVGTEVLAYGRMKDEERDLIGAPPVRRLVGRIDAQTCEFSIDYDAIREVAETHRASWRDLVREPGKLFELNGEYHFTFDWDGSLWTLNFVDKDTAHRFLADERHQQWLEGYTELLRSLAFEGLRPKPMWFTQFEVQRDFTLRAVKLLPPKLCHRPQGVPRRYWKPCLVVAEYNPLTGELHHH